MSVIATSPNQAYSGLQSTVSNQSVPSVTPENHIQLVGERIRQKEDQLGIPRGSLPLNQKTAILEAYRQLAGMPARFQTVDSNGLLVSDVIDVPFFLDVTRSDRRQLDQAELLGGFDGLTNLNRSSLALTGFSLNELGGKATEILPTPGQALTTINLVAIAGIIIGGVLLLGKVT